MQWSRVAREVGLPQSRGERVLVRKGDTLWSLVDARLQAGGQERSAAAIQRGVRAVAAANGIADPDRIYVSDQLDLSVLRHATRHAAPASVWPDVPSDAASGPGGAPASAGAGAGGRVPDETHPLLTSTLDRAVRMGYLPEDQRQQVRDRVVQIASRLGFAPDDLARVALLESDGFNPRASNGRCFGVIQFCEGAGRGADSVGYRGRAADITQLSVLAQLELVERYLADVGVGSSGGPVTLDDLYLAVLMPSARTRGDPQAALDIPGPQARVLHEGMDRRRPITRRSLVAGLHLQAQRVLGGPGAAMSEAASAGQAAATQRQGLAAVGLYRQVAAVAAAGAAPDLR